MVQQQQGHFSPRAKGAGGAAAELGWGMVTVVQAEGTGAPGLGLGSVAEEVSCEETPLDLFPEQVPLMVRPLHEAPVLLGPAGQVRQHLVHRPVGHVLVDREASLACRERGCGSGKCRESKKNVEK